MCNCGGSQPVTVKQGIAGGSAQPVVQQRTVGGRVWQGSGQKPAEK